MTRRTLARALVVLALTLVFAVPFGAPSSSTASAAMMPGDTSGSYTLFPSTPTPVGVSWSYTASSNVIDITVTLKTSVVGTAQLKPTEPTDQVVGTVSGDTVTITFGANYSTHKLGATCDVTGVNGNKSGMHTVDF